MKEDGLIWRGRQETSADVQKQRILPQKVRDLAREPVLDHLQTRSIIAWKNIVSMGRPQVNLMFRAFSDRTRLRILHLLRPGELCVGDLVRILAVPQPTASRHLAYLRRAGLVLTRKNGLWSFYRLAPASNAFHRQLLACLSSCFRDVPEVAADLRAATRVRKSGGCCPG